MLAGKSPDDLTSLKFPLLASPKLDGIRFIIFNGFAYSRNLKRIPNRRIQTVAKTLPHGLDGELISGSPTSPDAWNRTQSCVMKADSTDAFCFHAFDIVADEPFLDRFTAVRSWCLSNGAHHICYVPHKIIRSFEELAQYEGKCVREGYEGVMLRSLDGPYKYGRSTAREGSLLKMKRFDDAEARVIGVVEKMHNDNAATKDELGRTKRSSAKAGKRPAGTMGALKCRWLNGIEFELGTGFSDEERSRLWADRKNFKNWPPRKHKYQGLTPDGKPRFPVDLGFRDPVDA